MTALCFSIIIPVYNAALTLGDTIASVLAQTEGSFEILLIDDGSTDDSLKVAIMLSKQDQRIRVISTKNNGASATRNLGMQLSKGEFIAFLDADDIWVATKLEMHLQLHRARPEISATYARISFLGPDARPQSWSPTTSSIFKGALTLTELIGENAVCTMSNFVLARASLHLFGEFRDDMSHAEDQEWLVGAVSRGAVIMGIDQILVGYRLSPAGLSTNLEAMYKGWLSIALRYRHQISFRSAQAIYFRYLARRALRMGAPPSAAIRFVRKGLQCDRAAFLNDSKRGWMTVIFAFAAVFLPRSVRQWAFA
jgi:glycosyltransferase involved in cell wall biosynthesis